MGEPVQGFVYYLASLPSRSSQAGLFSSRSSHAGKRSSGNGEVPFAYHTSIVVFNTEYSYDEDEGVSITKLEPKRSNSPNFKGSYNLGTTKKTKTELNNHVATLMTQGWNKVNYDFIAKNCILFCQELIRFLEVDDLPSFVRKLPKVAKDLVVSKPGLIASVISIGLAGARWGLLGIGGAVLGIVGIAGSRSSSKKKDKNDHTN